MMNENEWIAICVGSLWKPALQMLSGCLDLDVWFETEDLCVEWMRAEMLGATFP